MKNIGKNIRIIREIKDLTQEGLAKLTGYSQRHISRLENNQSPINEKCLNSIAKALDISKDEIKKLDETSFLEYIKHLD